MIEQEKQTGQTALINELETSLTRLESALADAGRAIGAIRNCIPQIAALVDVVNTMESAMSSARQRLGAVQTVETAPIPAMPQQQPTIEPAPAPEPAAQELRDRDALAQKVQLIEELRGQPEGAPTQYCLRLRVGSKVGSLDLKAVDNAVNEQAAVSDVALIDYDGRQATLRIWISGTESPESVIKALHQSLRSRLGDEDEADVDIEFEERAAA